MTPEERTAEIDVYGSHWTGPDMHERIAAAIRAAENDALERAATNLDQEVLVSENCGPGAAIENVCFRDGAKIVRALKHKEAT